MTATMLPLFQRICWCLLGEAEDAQDGHEGQCVVVCLACRDAIAGCDICRMDLLIEDLQVDSSRTARLGRTVVTLVPRWGLFDGWATEVRIRWNTYRDTGRPWIVADPVAPHHDQPAVASGSKVSEAPDA